MLQLTNLIDAQRGSARLWRDQAEIGMDAAGDCQTRRARLTSGAGLLGTQQGLGQGQGGALFADPGRSDEEIGMGQTLDRQGVAKRTQSRRLTFYGSEGHAGKVETKRSRVKRKRQVCDLGLAACPIRSSTTDTIC